MTPTSRSLISAAREGLAPDAAAMARVRARVAAAAGAGVALGAAKAAAKPMSLATKLALVTAIAGTATGIAFGLAHDDSASAPTITPATSLDDSRVTAHVAAEPAPPPAIATAPVVVHRVRPGHPEPAPVVTPETSTDSLAVEVEIIDRAMLALRRGNADGALAAIADFDRITAGHGQLAEDAAAISLEAHCRMHDDVAGALGDFDRNWPHSAQRARITAACSR